MGEQKCFCVVFRALTASSGEGGGWHVGSILTLRLRLMESSVFVPSLESVLKLLEVKCSKLTR